MALRAYEMVTLIKVVEALDRIPDELEDDFTFFAERDLWRFESVEDETVCWLCKDYDGSIYLGSQIRTEWPYLEIESDELIHPHVHPNCRCRLWRMITTPSTWGR